MDQNKIERIGISVHLINSILQYLGNRPWVEADPLISAIKTAAAEHAEVMAAAQILPTADVPATEG